MGARSKGVNLAILTRTMEEGVSRGWGYGCVGEEVRGGARVRGAAGKKAILTRTMGRGVYAFWGEVCVV